MPIQKIFLLPPLKGLNLYDNPFTMSPDYATELVNFMPPTTTFQVRPSVEFIMYLYGNIRGMMSYSVGSTEDYGKQWWASNITYGQANLLLMKSLNSMGKGVLWMVDPKGMTYQQVGDNIAASFYNDDCVLYKHTLFFTSGQPSSAMGLFHKDKGSAKFAMRIGDDGQYEIGDMQNITSYKNYIFCSQNQGLNIYVIKAQYADILDPLNNNFWVKLENLFSPKYAVTFSLDGLLQKGGAILKMFNMSRGGSDELSSYFACITTEGEIIIFDGTDPTDEDKWQCVGRFEIAPPLNKYAMCEMDGDYIVATRNGLISLKRVIFGQSSEITENLEFRIMSLFNQYQFKMPAFTQFIGLYYHPRNRLLIFNIPISLPMSLNNVISTFTFTEAMSLSFKSDFFTDTTQPTFLDQLKSFILGTCIQNCVDYVLCLELNNDYEMNSIVYQIATNYNDNTHACDFTVSFFILQFGKATQFLSENIVFNCPNIYDLNPTLTITSGTDVNWNPSFLRNLGKDSQYIYPFSPDGSKVDLEITNILSYSTSFATPITQDTVGIVESSNNSLQIGAYYSGILSDIATINFYRIESETRARVNDWIDILNTSDFGFINFSHRTEWENLDIFIPNSDGPGTLLSPLRLFQKTLLSTVADWDYDHYQESEFTLTFSTTTFINKVGLMQINLACWGKMDQHAGIWDMNYTFSITNPHNNNYPLLVCSCYGMEVYTGTGSDYSFSWQDSQLVPTKFNITTYNTDFGNFNLAKTDIISFGAIDDQTHPFSISVDGPSKQNPQLQVLINNIKNIGLYNTVNWTGEWYYNYYQYLFSNFIYLQNIPVFDPPPIPPFTAVVSLNIEQIEELPYSKKSLLYVYISRTLYDAFGDKVFLKYNYLDMMTSTAFGVDSFEKQGRVFDLTFMNYPTICPLRAIIRAWQLSPGTDVVYRVSGFFSTTFNAAGSNYVIQMNFVLENLDMESCVGIANICVYLEKRSNVIFCMNYGIQNGKVMAYYGITSVDLQESYFNIEPLKREISWDNNCTVRLHGSEELANTFISYFLADMPNGQYDSQFKDNYGFMLDFLNFSNTTNYEPLDPTPKPPINIEPQPDIPPQYVSPVSATMDSVVDYDLSSDVGMIVGCDILQAFATIPDFLTGGQYFNILDVLTNKSFGSQTNYLWRDVDIDTHITGTKFLSPLRKVILAIQQTLKEGLSINVWNLSSTLTATWKQPLIFKETTFWFEMNVKVDSEPSTNSVVSHIEIVLYDTDSPTNALQIYNVEYYIIAQLYCDNITVSTKNYGAISLGMFPTITIDAEQEIFFDTTLGSFNVSPSGGTFAGLLEIYLKLQFPTNGSSLSWAESYAYLFSCVYLDSKNAITISLAIMNIFESVPIHVYRYFTCGLDVLNLFDDKDPDYKEINFKTIFIDDRYGVGIFAIPADKKNDDLLPINFTGKSQISPLRVFIDATNALLMDFFPGRDQSSSLDATFKVSCEIKDKYSSDTIDIIEIVFTARFTWSLDINGYHGNTYVLTLCQNADSSAGYNVAHNIIYNNDQMTYSVEYISGDENFWGQNDFSKDLNLDKVAEFIYNSADNKWTFENDYNVPEALKDYLKNKMPENEPNKNWKDKYGYTSGYFCFSHNEFPPDPPTLPHWVGIDSLPVREEIDMTYFTTYRISEECINVFLDDDTKYKTIPFKDLISSPEAGIGNFYDFTPTERTPIETNYTDKEEFSIFKGASEVISRLFYDKGRTQKFNVIATISFNFDIRIRSSFPDDSDQYFHLDFIGTFNCENYYADGSEFLLTYTPTLKIEYSRGTSSHIVSSLDAEFLYRMETSGIYGDQLWNNMTNYKTSGFENYFTPPSDYIASPYIYDVEWGFLLTDGDKDILDYIESQFKDVFPGTIEDEMRRPYGFLTSIWSILSTKPDTKIPKKKK